MLLSLGIPAGVGNSLRSRVLGIVFIPLSQSIKQNRPVVDLCSLQLWALPGPLQIHVVAVMLFLFKQ